MDWLQFLLALISIGSLIWKTRGDTKDDISKLENKIENLLKEVRDDMKDFHGRLCTIEERNKAK